MSRYRKALVAVAGGLAQVAIVAGDAVDSGVVPPSWVPWVRVVVALGTAVAVYAVPNTPGRHEAVSSWTQSGRQA